MGLGFIRGVLRGYGADLGVLVVLGCYGGYGDIWGSFGEIWGNMVYFGVI